MVASIFPWHARAQGATAPRYEEGQFACIAIHQTVTSDVETLRGEVRRTESVVWNGDLVVDGRMDSTGSFELVAWFESLDVWRDAPEGRWAPSAAGMLGGRYRGVLDSVGVFTRSTTPFIPDAVGSVAALGKALDELWPPAPIHLPEVGGSVTIPLGWHLDRLTDTTWGGGSAWRFRLDRTDTTVVTVEWGDGLLAEGQSVEEEEGRLVWHLSLGPVRWTRRIRTTVTFPPTAVTTEAVRTEVRQNREFRRGEALPTDRCLAL